MNDRPLKKNRRTIREHHWKSRLSDSARTRAWHRGHHLHSSRIRKSGRLELHERANYTGRKNNVPNEMIGKFSRDRVDGETIGILFSPHKPPSELPGRVVAGHEHDATMLESQDAVILRRERTLGRLEVGGIVGECRWGHDKRITRDIAASQFGQLVLVPHVLIEKGKMRRAMGRGHAQEVGLFERPDLRVHRIAHAV